LGKLQCGLCDEGRTGELCRCAGPENKSSNFAAATTATFFCSKKRFGALKKPLSASSFDRCASLRKVQSVAFIKPLTSIVVAVVVYFFTLLVVALSTQRFYFLFLLRRLIDCDRFLFSSDIVL
jgi:hypothetical protein